MKISFGNSWWMLVRAIHDTTFHKSKHNKALLVTVYLTLNMSCTIILKYPTFNWAYLLPVTIFWLPFNLLKKLPVFIIKAPHSSPSLYHHFLKGQGDAPINPFIKFHSYPTATYSREPSHKYIPYKYESKSDDLLYWRFPLCNNTPYILSF